MTKFFLIAFDTDGKRTLLGPFYDSQSVERTYYHFFARMNWQSYICEKVQL